MFFKLSAMSIVIYLLFVITDGLTGGGSLPSSVRNMASIFALSPIFLSFFGLVISIINSIKSKVTESSGFAGNLIILFMYLFFIILLVITLNNSPF